MGHRLGKKLGLLVTKGIKKYLTSKMAIYSKFEHNMELQNNKKAKVYNG